MSRRRESYQLMAALTDDELAAMRYGTRSREPRVVLTDGVDLIDAPSFWRAAGLAVAVNVVGMLAVAAAAWRVLGA